MLELLDLISSSDFEAASVSVEQSALGGSDLTLVVSVDSHQEGDTPSRWAIRCHDPLEQHLDLTGSGSTIELLSSHPLLLRHNAQRGTLYFHGTPAAAPHVIGELVLAHESVSHGWVPFPAFLTHTPLAPLLGGGFGLLAEGPLPFISAYAEVLSRHTLSPSVVAVRGPVRWRSAAWQDLATPYQVLITGETYVVAQQFSAQQTEA